MSAGFHTIAADGHIAPHPAPVLAPVQKQPSAIGADLQSRRFPFPEQAQGGVGRFRFKRMSGRPSQDHCDCLKHRREMPLVLAAKGVGTKIGIDRFAQRQKSSAVIGAHRGEFAEQRPFGRLLRGSHRKGFQLLGHREPIDTPHRIGAHGP